MRACLALGVLLVIGGCSSSGSDRSQVPPAGTAESGGSPSRAAVSAAELEQAATAYFAGGCFWGVEHYLEKLDGVLAVESGYMGGSVESPTYEDVLTKQSGHFETVRVRYDPARIGYEAVAKMFFEIHDPTQADGQGPDIGPQYRSAIFVSSPRERDIIESLIAQLRSKGFDVVTEIREADRFWPAEDYHQDYYVRHDKVPYCHGYVDRFDDDPE